MEKPSLYIKPVIRLGKNRDIVAGKLCVSRRCAFQSGLSLNNASPDAKAIPCYVDLALSEEFFALARQMQQSSKELVPILMRISDDNMLNESFIDSFLSHIKKSGLPYEYVQLELRESMFMQDERTAYRLVNKLRTYGVGFFMQEFGSTFLIHTMVDLPIDILKVDAASFQHSYLNEREYILLSHISRLAKGLDMVMLCDNITDEQQADMFFGGGCALAQGGLYGSFVPLPQFIQKVNT